MAEDRSCFAVVEGDRSYRRTRDLGVRAGLGRKEDIGSPGRDYSRGLEIGVGKVDCVGRSLGLRGSKIRIGSRIVGERQRKGCVDRSFAGGFGCAGWDMVVAVGAGNSRAGRGCVEGIGMSQDCRFGRIVGNCSRDSRRSWVGAGLSCAVDSLKSCIGWRIAGEGADRLLGEPGLSILLLRSSYDLH